MRFPRRLCIEPQQGLCCLQGRIVFFSSACVSRRSSVTPTRVADVQWSLVSLSLWTLLLQVKCILLMRHSGRSAGMVSIYGDTLMCSHYSRVAWAHSPAVFCALFRCPLSLSGRDAVEYGGAHGCVHRRLCSLLSGLFACVCFSFSVHRLASHYFVVWRMFSCFRLLVCSCAPPHLSGVCASPRCVRRGVVLRRVPPPASDSLQWRFGSLSSQYVCM